MKKLLSLLMLGALVGCTTQVYELSPKNTASQEPNYDKFQHFFVSGIGQESEVNAAEICGGADKVAKVETKQTFLNGFVGMISYGIYTPRQMKVYCQ